MIFDLTTVGEYAAIQGGYAYKSQDFQANGQWKVLKIKNIRNGYISYDDTSFVSDETASKTKEWMTRAGDVLISMTGSGPSAPDSLVGRVARVWEGEEPALINQRVGRLVLKHTNKIYPDFLFYLLSSKECQNFLVSNSTGSANQVNISSKIIESVICPRIDFETSKTIADMLKTLDKKIKLLIETNATLEAIAQALFKSWFVDFDPVHAKAEGRQPEGIDAETAALFPDSFEESELGLVPKGWRVTALDMAYEINPTRKLKKGESAPYLDMANVPTNGHHANVIIDREMSSGSKFINGDTLLARITPCLENGKTAFVDFLIENQIGWGSTEFVVLRSKAPLPLYHGYLLCRYNQFREFAIRSMSGTSGRQRIQNDVLGRYLVVIPTQIIAEKFGAIVTPIQQKISHNSNEAKTLSKIRDSLLPKLISGEIRICDAEQLVEITA